MLTRDARHTETLDDTLQQSSINFFAIPMVLDLLQNGIDQFVVLVVQVCKHVIFPLNQGELERIVTIG